MSDLIDTTEMYLRTIYELMEEGIVPLRARIAERLHQSGPTVSQTVARMERDGLLHVDYDRHLELSPHGRSLAIAVMRKHRLAERLLVDVIGLDWELVHDEACRWEHVISEDVEKRLVEILHSPEVSPYGNPIPGMAELGLQRDSEEFREGADPLPQVVGDSEHVQVVLRRMSENTQAEADNLEQLSRSGIRPGVEFSVHRGGVGYVLQVEGHEPCDVIEAVADGLFVSRL